jgi:hypothetical protein
MSTRISSALILPLSLAACGGKNQPAPPPPGDAIDCAVDSAASFQRVCTVSEVRASNGPMLTVNNPDGGFHRLAVTRDGRGVIAADGAEAARVTVIGNGMIEVAIGQDRYRLPAHVKGQAAP